MKGFTSLLRYGLLVAALTLALSGPASTVFANGGGGMGGGAGGGTGGSGTGGSGTGGGGTGGGGGSNVSSPADPINPQARTFFNQGMGYVKEKKWFLAISAFTQAVHIDPKFAAAWNNWGHSYRKAQQYSNALDAYKQAIDLAPGDPNPHEYLARTYLAMGNKDAAKREYEAVRRLDPKLADELFKAIQANDPDLGDE